MNGACMCGAISFRALAPPYHISKCQCSFCSRLVRVHGVVEYLFFKEQIVVEKGEPRTHLHEVQITGEKLEVSFCRDCGSQLFVESAEYGHCKSILSSANFDNPLPDGQETVDANNHMSKASFDTKPNLYMGHEKA